MSALCQARQRSRYLDLFQIVGVLGVVAVHVGVPYSNSVWIVVEVFFVIAGINMAKALDSGQSISGYAVSRIRRLGPEVLAIWSAAVVLVVSGEGSSGMLWFIFTSPAFMQNLGVAFFRYTMPNDWAFAPLWFVGALLQLQFLLFVVRRVLLRAKPEVLVFACAGIGTLVRLVFAMLSGENLHSLSKPQATVLFCLPLTHLEPLVLGVLIGRGGLPRIGRLLPFFCVVTLGLGAVNVALSGGEVSSHSLGFPHLLRLNYAYLWGYPILALTAASLCSPNGRLAVAVEGLTLPGWADNMVLKLASLTYGAYAFHGLVMATGLNAAMLLTGSHTRKVQLLLFALTAVQSFLIAWGFDLTVRGFRGLRWRPVPGNAQTA
jgi:hypothetical protein